MQKTKIYKDSYQLMIHVFNRTKTFPKFYRPTLGRRLEENSLDLTQIIAQAMMLSSSHKIQHKTDDSKNNLRYELFLKSSMILDQFRVLLNLSKDLQVLNIAGYEELTIQSREIGRELGGMLKYAKQQQQ
jgi:23S rRNA-intervening sequence protein